MSHPSPYPLFPVNHLFIFKDLENFITSFYSLSFITCILLQILSLLLGKKFCDIRVYILFSLWYTYQTYVLGRVPKNQFLHFMDATLNLWQLLEAEDGMWVAVLLNTIFPLNLQFVCVCVCVTVCMQLYSSRIHWTISLFFTSWKCDTMWKWCVSWKWLLTNLKDPLVLVSCHAWYFYKFILW